MNTPNVASRHAQTLEEIKAMSENYSNMQAICTEQIRKIDALQNKVDLLQVALDDSRHAERVYRHKLIRLASAMENISLLTTQAEGIMKDAREIDELATNAEAADEAPVSLNKEPSA
jgi:hypothetical protein